MTTRETILEFLSMTGFDKSVDQFINGHIANFREKFEAWTGEDLPENILKTVAAVESAHQGSREVLREKVIALYEKHYTPDEMTQLVAFYKAELGQKLIANGEALSNEINEARNAWSIDAMKICEQAISDLLSPLIVAAPGSAQATPIDLPIPSEAPAPEANAG